KTFMNVLKASLIGQKFYDLIVSPKDKAAEMLKKIRNPDWKELVKIIRELDEKERKIANGILTNIENDIALELHEAEQDKAPNREQIYKETFYWKSLSGGVRYIQLNNSPTPYDIRFFTTDHLPEASTDFGAENITQPGFFLKPSFRVKHVPLYGV